MKICHEDSSINRRVLIRKLTISDKENQSYRKSEHRSKYMYNVPDYGCATLDQSENLLPGPAGLSERSGSRWSGCPYVPDRRPLRQHSHPRHCLLRMRLRTHRLYTKVSLIYKLQANTYVIQMFKIEPISSFNGEATCCN